MVEGFRGGQPPRNFYRFKKPGQAGFPWMIELLVTLAPVDRVEVSERVREHLRQFVAAFPARAPEWTAIRQAVQNLPEPASLLAQMNDVFILGAG